MSELIDWMLEKVRDIQYKTWNDQGLFKHGVLPDPLGPLPTRKIGQNVVPSGKLYSQNSVLFFPFNWFSDWKTIEFKYPPEKILGMSIPIESIIFIPTGWKILPGLWEGGVLLDCVFWEIAILWKWPLWISVFVIRLELVASCCRERLNPMSHFHEIY